MLISSYSDKVCNSYKYTTILSFDKIIECIVYIILSFIMS